MSNNERVPCPVCGRQPRFRSLIDGAIYCDHEYENKGVLYGPEQDPDGALWDAMCRTIRARALADVRAKQAVSLNTLDVFFHEGRRYVLRDDVMALLDNKEN